ncbi:hypothetical protein [Pelagerythrobacter marensis]|uniref:Uncharacterized protein n=1 Tax=Pelagerythrobacter marensis TaxID=543877 RepID=A0A0G3X3S5_9SPHN|nr:hypothetical protein [Pelagerythrobacter marensis]AKM06170.1 hypothetical protein AM2010_78 [Pelagerythrobacter marensis]
MKKTLVALAATAALCTATSASADTWSPSGSWQMSGTVAVQKGISLNCPLTINATVPSGGATASATPSFSGFPCGTITFNGTPYLAELQPDGTTLTLFNVSVNTITSGGCSGDISGQWDNSAKTLTVNTTLPETAPGTGDCTIAGTLTLNSPSGGSITP